jgi:signal transduction histidine kinase
VRYRGIIWVLLAVLASGASLSLYTLWTGVDTRPDMVLANDLLKTVEKHWNRPEDGGYREDGMPFAVLNNEGVLRYQTPGGHFVSIHEAIRNRDVIMDVTVQGSVVGKLVIQNEEWEKERSNRKQLASIIVASYGLLAGGGGLYLYMLNRSILRPFRRLQRFASNVARGNLDLPLPMDRNNPFGAFTESFDILREELAVARQNEYEANRSKKELVASLSHDIKTPVASITALTELMLLRAKDEKEVKQLGTIHAKADQIHRLITDMFHSTMEELAELHVSPAEEPSVILRDMIEQGDYDGRIRCGAIPECLLYADRTRLQQVIDNVISNAYKYADTPVTVRSSLIAGFLRVEIMDFGEGVGEQELPLLFNKYYRGPNSSGQSGAGIGLYISRHLMERMGGGVECHNRDDGFSIILFIPLAHQ